MGPPIADLSAAAPVPAYHSTQENISAWMLAAPQLKSVSEEGLKQWLLGLLEGKPRKWLQRCSMTSCRLFQAQRLLEQNEIEESPTSRSYICQDLLLEKAERNVFCVHVPVCV
jgi:hypothetical protein